MGVSGLNNFVAGHEANDFSEIKSIRVRSTIRDNWRSKHKISIENFIRPNDFLNVRGTWNF